MVRTRGAKNSTKAAVEPDETEEGQPAITITSSEAEAPMEAIDAPFKKRAREEKEETTEEKTEGAEEDGGNEKAAIQKDETKEEVRSSTVWGRT